MTGLRPALEGWVPPLIVVGGPTATGKTGFALDAAVALQGAGIPAAIVNADAMQLYRGMEIGTAKTPVDERREVPHLLFDELEVTARASVAAYQQRARSEIERLQSAGVVPFLVGGSGLYLESVIHDLHFPGSDPDIRAQVIRELDEHGPEPLLSELAGRAPAEAERLRGGDPRRLIRSIEVLRLTGEPARSALPERPRPWRPYTLIVIDFDDRALLAQRIRGRAEQMWASGLAGETDRLLDRGLRGSPTASKAIGYAQAMEFLDGTMTASEAVDQISRATVKLTKRQRTWFRRYPDATRLDGASLSPDSGRALAATIIADHVVWRIHGGAGPSAAAQGTAGTSTPFSALFHPGSRGTAGTGDRTAPDGPGPGPGAISPHSAASEADPDDEARPDGQGTESRMDP
ncbi:MAG: tRNA (adenosine(37)-N6)-dimethylallyltransferase MiaA [Microbacteriaceae bacterium]|jgi:tRNA dimethylallyltransferase|nr:tRNA (adenosine(37)-N6)-dimethylallyltransferase MiaA [Microbacteriaceae bacterium]MCI1207052.1 tRNA (adenosine(37)-N6)-dimethylallyltransferase MiaA [Microbacteriaceae bacterium]